jgi:threonine dehydrogenase-like Zn-dependent dehydrogenase
MKAAVFLGNRIEIQELPLPEINEKEVLLKVLGCGVCGTDAHIYNGDIKDARPPVILGHEIYAQVHETGREVQGLKKGDPVVVDPFIFCGNCFYCSRGEFRFCENETFLGYRRNGGFSQYTSLPEANVYRVPSDWTIGQGILTETVSTVLAGLSRLGPEAGRSALILGAGTVGLLWNQVLRRSLVTPLIQTELLPERQRLAARFGADEVLSPAETDLERAVQKLCPRGVDYLIDTTGSTEAIEQALPLLNKGGALMSFGICPQEERLSLCLYGFYRRQLRLLTSRRPPREMPRAIALLSRNLLQIGPLLTGSYPLEQIEETFSRFAHAKDTEIKMIIDPWL